MSAAVAWQGFNTGTTVACARGGGGRAAPPRPPPPPPAPPPPTHTPTHPPSDANEYQALGGKYGVQGFPTIKVFGAKKSSPTNYEGPRTAAGIVDFALKVCGP
jgi:hypothetical protein